MKQFVVLRLILVQASTSEQLPVGDTQTILLSVTNGEQAEQKIPFYKQLFSCLPTALPHWDSGVHSAKALETPCTKAEHYIFQKIFIFYHMWQSIPNPTWKVNRMQLFLLLLWQIDASPGFQSSDKISPAATQEYFNVGFFARSLAIVQIVALVWVNLWN